MTAQRTCISKRAPRGVLTLPEGKRPFPAVVLISGSGAQNPDEKIFGHKPFCV